LRGGKRTYTHTVTRSRSRATRGGERHQHIRTHRNHGLVTAKRNVKMGVQEKQRRGVAMCAGELCRAKTNTAQDWPVLPWSSPLLQCEALLVAPHWH
jgi:hypothetical protein